MFWAHVDRWLYTTPIALLGVIIPVVLAAAVFAGIAARRLSDRRDAARDAPVAEGLEGVMVSAVLGLMALFMGFTFSLVLNRFDDRRSLVLQEANAIGTVYLRAQLLEQPHRARIGELLIRYTDTRIALAKGSRGQTTDLMAGNDRLLTDLWAATVAAYPSMREPGLSGRFLESMNALIDLDTSRKMARLVHVPAPVYLVLFVFLAAAVAILGYLSVERRGKVVLALVVTLLSLALLLILDVDRPTGGGIQEDQKPMELLRASLKGTPAAAFDRYLLDDAKLAGGAAEAKASAR